MKTRGIGFAVLVSIAMLSAAFAQDFLIELSDDDSPADTITQDENVVEAAIIEQDEITSDEEAVIADDGYEEVVQDSVLQQTSSLTHLETAAAGTTCGETCTVGCPTCCNCDLFDEIEWPYPFDLALGNTPLLYEYKNRPSALSDDITYSLGGEFRFRYMDERNRLRPGIPPTGARTRYNLWRFTPYGSVSFGNVVTGYIQGIHAEATGYDLPLTPDGADINRHDVLRYYGELNLGDVACGNLKYRYGRQFLKYGSQHLLSPLGWQNTFRNFEGHKLIYTNDTWSVDAFAMNSVNAVAGGSNFSRNGYDTPDHDRWMNGVYATYKGIENNVLDLYWLWSNEENPNVTLHDGERHTVGLRLAGSKARKDCDDVVGTFQWDFEGAYQFGEDSFTGVAPGGSDLEVNAGFVSLLGGYTFNCATWSPAINGIFYWGSGDSDPTDQEINTFHSLYPLGHAYWGLIDNFSGQNLLDYGVQASVQPHKRLGLSATYHWFDRATDNDAVYNIVGAQFAAGTPGAEIGNELDLIANVKVSDTLSVQVGYFFFWYGEAINNGAPRPDAEQFYTMITWGF